MISIDGEKWCKEWQTAIKVREDVVRLTYLYFGKHDCFFFSSISLLRKNGLICLLSGSLIYSGLCLYECNTLRMSVENSAFAGTEISCIPGAN